MATVRICVCGDEGTGKSSLVTSLVKDVFVTSKIQATLPQITIPPFIGTPENVTTTVVDTSALPHERTELNKEIRKSNVILLVYSDHYSYERVALFWLPHFRSLAVNVPVVLCANKSDLTKSTSTDQVVDDEMLPVMDEFKEIDSCIRTSAREHHNINELFFLCQKAVTDPIAPLYDSKESALKPACVSALQRIFYLCDRDRDGYLSDAEVHDFQFKCFRKPLSDVDLSVIKSSIQRYSPDSVTEKGISQSGFIQLNKLFAEKGRHETIWLVLRTFHYTESLSLHSSFLSPKFDVPANSSAELSPAGYRFFVDLFLLHDKDNDGGLSPSELSALFAPTPGLPSQWLENDFPSCTVRNDAGYVTLQGWLAQWSMTTFLFPKTTLSYLAYFGFDTSLPSSNAHPTTSALTITKPRKRPPHTTAGRRRLPPISRTVLQAFIIGAPYSGKSTLLHTFLSRPLNTASGTYSPTLSPSTVVNTVELPGGKQVTLLLSDLASHESAILANPSALSKCDILIYAYDSSDPHSFAHIPALREKHKHLDECCPAMFVATKADKDRVTQDWEVQPEEYCGILGVAKPSHVSVEWGSVPELWIRVAEVGLDPGTAFVRREGEAEGEEEGWKGWWIAVGAVGVVTAAALGMWKRMSV
ncbi:MAG: hypothetical protein LQ348_001965 [Seirophora lacunosa]|nr:MAG: hypothetical protein LQ348_001965 [Seirophora lacunosa]